MGKRTCAAVMGALTALLTPLANAVIISGTPITFGPNPLPMPPGTHKAHVIQALNGDYTETWFNYAGTTLNVTAWNLDESSDWYLVNEGAPFTAATIASGQFTTLLDLHTPPSPVTIPQGVFYLGVATSVGSLNRDVFGWLKLNNTGTALQQLDDAMAYGEQGIYVGTTIAVPEPVMSAAALCCTWVLAARRKSSASPR